MAASALVLIGGAATSIAFAVDRNTPRAWSVQRLPEAVQVAVYPVVLLLLLRRPQIKSLFELPAGGFEVQRQSGPAPAGQRA